MDKAVTIGCTKKVVSYSREPAVSFCQMLNGLRNKATLIYHQSIPSVTIPPSCSPGQPRGIYAPRQGFD